MLAPDRHTAYRWPLIWVGAALLAAGAICLARVIHLEAAWGAVAADLVIASFGWGAFAEVLKGGLTALGIAALKPTGGVTHGALLLAGAGLWLAGWVVIALGTKSQVAANADAPESEAVGAQLYPPLARYRDFHWGTLLAYGGGILAAELALIFIQQLLSAGVLISHTGAEVAETTSGFAMNPVMAFMVSGGVAAILAFAGGFIGAMHSRRLSAPEATIGLLYLGLPIPLLLTLIPYVPRLQLQLGPRVSEILYLANLLGRPELGYWLVFVGLVLVMMLGIISGFVATGSGRVDLRTGFERFVARRHVSVFRPKLLLGALGVLLLGIIPPLLIYAIIRAAEQAVERTRIRELGLADPLKAATAMNAAKQREQTPTEMMTALSVGGVGVGVMALIVVMSVMNGFEIDLQQKILGTNAHAIILKYSNDFSEWPEVMKKAREVKGVVGATPFVLSEVMIQADDNISGAIIKGIDPDTVGQVTELEKYILPGGLVEYLDDPAELTPRRRLNGFDDRAANSAGGRTPGGGLYDDGIIQMPDAAQPEPPLPGIILGRELAQSLRVALGDRVNVISPLGGGLGPNGPIPKSRPFRVAGISYSGMYEYDSKFTYIQLEEAQKFFNVKGVNGIELKVDDIDDARRISNVVLDRLEGYPYRTNFWGEMNKSLFAALRLEKLVMGIILSIIVIVAAGLIVATVIMLVLEKRKEISVLKALGVPDGGIVKIFLAEGLQIGVAGGLLGLIAGLAWCWFIAAVGLRLDPEIYYIPALPVKVEPIQTAIPVVIAVLVTYVASIYPALKASRVEPVEGLKSE